MARRRRPPYLGCQRFRRNPPHVLCQRPGRLAVSAHLAAEGGHLPLEKKDICDSILEGYREALRTQGLPFVLGENNDWLRQMAEGELRDPVHFWAKLDVLPTLKVEIPISALDALDHLMPAKDLDNRLADRVAAGTGAAGSRPLRRHRQLGTAGASPAKQMPGFFRLNWAKDEDGPSEISIRPSLAAPSAVLTPSSSSADAGSSAASAPPPPHRTRHPESSRQGTPLDSRHGMETATLISAQEQPENPSSATCKTEAKMAAPRHRKDAEPSPRRLEDLEERRLRVSGTNVGGVGSFVKAASGERLQSTAQAVAGASTMPQAPKGRKMR